MDKLNEQISIGKENYLLNVDRRMHNQIILITLSTKDTHESVK